MKNPKGAILVILGLVFIFVVIPVGWDLVTGKIGPEKKDSVVVEKEECRGGPVTVDDGIAVQWSKAKYPKKGEMVTFEGYVELPNMTFLNGGTYMVSLRQYPTHDSGTHITILVLEGDCENTMIPLPSNYEEEDLFIYDNAGEEIVSGEKARVTGKVHDDGSLYQVRVKRIEKIEAVPGDSTTSARLKKQPVSAFFGRLQMKPGISELRSRQMLVCQRNYFYFCRISGAMAAMANTIQQTEIHKQS
ncbi:MAG TPA: hypothetical protein VK826_20615 [Bacteroidia bacterium]|nr:hypothetical protein [Bacteroidia bacterium]